MYTVFYLYSILVIELMHVSIIVQPTLYITVLHTSHILVNYKYISFVAQLYIVRLDFVAVGNMCVTNSQTIAPVHLYFHPEVRTHAPTHKRHDTAVCALCDALPPVHVYIYDTQCFGATIFWRLH